MGPHARLQLTHTAAIANAHASLRCCCWCCCVVQHRTRVHARANLPRCVPLSLPHYNLKLKASLLTVLFNQGLFCPCFFYIFFHVFFFLVPSHFRPRAILLSLALCQQYCASLSCFFLSRSTKLAVQAMVAESKGGLSAVSWYQGFVCSSHDFRLCLFYLSPRVRYVTALLHWRNLIDTLTVDSYCTQINYNAWYPRFFYFQ